MSASILVSTAYMRQMLAEIDFDSDLVNSIVINGNTFVLKTYSKEVRFNATILRSSFGEVYYPQEKARWDWVKNLCNEVSDQPVKMTIKKQAISIEFQY